MDYDEQDFEMKGGVLRVKRPSLIVGGVFTGRIVRAGKVIEEWESRNLIVNQGLDYLLGVGFASAQQITQWYLAPFKGNYVPTGTDTAATFPTAATESTDYDGSSRPAYVAVEGAQQVTNAASPASFVFNAKTTVYGAFLISSSPFNSKTGILFAAAPFPTPKTPDPGDQLLLTYAFGAASA